MTAGEGPNSGVSFCLSSKSREGRSEVAIPFLVSEGESTAVGCKSVCIIHVAVHMARSREFVKGAKASAP